MQIVKNKIIIKKPFVIGALSFKFLNNSLEILRAAIIKLNKKELNKARIGSKLAIDNKSSSNFLNLLMKESNEISILINTLLSKELRKNILSKLCFKMILCRRDRYCLDLLLFKLFGFDCFNSRIEISVMEKGSFIPPHVDSKRKIFSGLIYLPSNSQINSKELGTEFWDYKKSNFNNKHLEDESDLKSFKNSANLIYKTPFEFSKMYYFLRSSTSWHSVSKVKNENRISVNYNIEIETSLMNKLQNLFSRYILRK